MDKATKRNEAMNEMERSHVENFEKIDSAMADATAELEREKE